MNRLIKGNILPLKANTVAELCLGVATRVEDQRLRLGWSRKTLATRAGISPWTLKHFEKTGKLSLETLVKIAVVLDSAADLNRLFEAKEEKPSSLADLEKLQPQKRMRGRTLP